MLTTLFRVCVCDSFGGKLHIGFVDIRNKLEGIREDRETRRVKRREDEEKASRACFTRPKPVYPTKKYLLIVMCTRYTIYWGGRDG